MTEQLGRQMVLSYIPSSPLGLFAKHNYESDLFKWFWQRLSPFAHISKMQVFSISLRSIKPIRLWLILTFRLELAGNHHMVSN